MKKLPLFLLALTSLAPAQLLPVVSEGKYEVAVPYREGEYASLMRSSDLITWKEVAMVSCAVSEEQRVLRDPLRPAKKGFYDVRYASIFSQNDADGDGARDFQELAAGTGLNPGSEVPFISGSLTLPDQATFDRLSKRDNFPGAQNVQEVKFLVTEVMGKPELYFFNVNQHQHHYIFAREVLGFYDHLDYWTGSSIFSGETYFTSVRKNLAGSLVYHENYIGPDGEEGIYTVEFWPTDPVAFEFIELAYEMIGANAPFIDRLVYHAPSETQREIQALEKESFEQSFIRSIETDDLFANNIYTPMNQRSAFGRLTLAEGTDTLSARDIVIFRNLPNDLTHVAGIITEVPQTPLSHVNLKAKQNDTPNAFIADASTHPDLLPFLGENVFYDVRPDGFEVRLASQAEVDAYFESIRPTDTSYPERNLSIQEIRPLSSIRFSNTSAFGGKATNLAELRKIMSANVPDGFAIPFYFYDEFMKHNGFYAQAQAMMAEPLFQNDPAARKAALMAFRSTMKKSSTMPAWMFDALTDLQGSFPADVTPRLRSSANAEDSVEFNGAGLYDSYTQKEDEGHISKSVRQVWASLWNYRAWEEREFYRIDHLTAAMGILVHPNFKNEQANGVAVARNIFDPNWEGYYFNVQIGEDLVTNPDLNSVPEEMLVASLATSEYEIQYIRSSNQLPLGERVLTREQVLLLVARMSTLNNHFDDLYPGADPDFAMEIEFKITEAGGLIIKQARPWVD